jgi:hypothetical protein
MEASGQLTSMQMIFLKLYRAAIAMASFALAVWLAQATGRAIGAGQLEFPQFITYYLAVGLLFVPFLWMKKLGGGATEFTTLPEILRLIQSANPSDRDHVALQRFKQIAMLRLGVMACFKTFAAITILAIAWYGKDRELTYFHYACPLLALVVFGQLAVRRLKG